MIVGLVAILALVLNITAVPALADTLPPDGDAWTESDSLLEALGLGWYVDNLQTQTLVVSAESRVGDWSVGCRALQPRWCDNFGLHRSEDLRGLVRIGFWHRGSWTGFDFQLRLYMTCTPEEIDQGYDLKRASWPMPSSVDWSQFVAELAAAEWAWRQDGWDWVYSGGNTDPTELVRIEWFFCQYFDVSVGDELLIDGLQLETDTAIAVGPGPRRPDLAPAVPNPFNPATEIVFTLTAAGPVRLVVYALDGRRVRTLADGLFPTGRHSVTWMGRDDAGQTLPSGTYQCVLEAGDWRRVRGVTLLK